MARKDTSISSKQPLPLKARVFPDGSERTYSGIRVTGRKEMEGVVIDIPGLAFLIFSHAGAKRLAADLKAALKQLA